MHYLVEDDPEITSGIRIGSPAVTSRGMGKGEVMRIAGLVDKALENRSDPEALAKVNMEVADLCRKFPVYKD